MNSASNIGGSLMQQFEAAKAIPMRVLSNWPVYFGFFGVNYAAAIILGLIPKFGGTVGTVENAAIQGMVQVIDHVTWEQLKVA